MKQGHQDAQAGVYTGQKSGYAVCRTLLLKQENCITDARGSHTYRLIYRALLSACQSLPTCQFLFNENRSSRI